MKSFSALKFWMPLLGLGAALALAPQSRAQAEVSPDHFDIGDSGAAPAATTAPAPKAKQASASSVQARNKKPSSHTTPQIASASLSESRQPDVLAIQDKRKTPARKPNQ